MLPVRGAGVQLFGTGSSARSYAAAMRIHSFIMLAAAMLVAGPAVSQSLVQPADPGRGGPNAQAAQRPLGPNAEAALRPAGPNATIARSSRLLAEPVRYADCAAAGAARATPIRRGEPGYGRHLDRDRDGIACE